MSPPRKIISLSPVAAVTARPLAFGNCQSGSDAGGTTTTRLMAGSGGQASALGAYTDTVTLTFTY